MSVRRRARKGAAGWEARFRDAGGIQRSKVFDSKEAAERFDAKNRRRRPDSTSGTLAAWADVWFAQHGRSWASSTREGREGLWRRYVKPRLGKVRLVDLDRRRVRAFLQGLVDDGVPASQVNDSLACLRAMLTAAVDDDVLDSNPAWRIKPLPEARVPPTVVHPLDVEKLRLRLQRRDRLAVALMAYAGLRPGEVWRLRWEDVTPRAVVVDATKTRTLRVVPIGDLLQLELLEAQVDARSIRVCPAPRAALVNHRNWTRRVWTPAVVAQGLPELDPYDLRHTYASLLIHEGVPLPEVARRMGHSSPRTTLLYYAHVIELARLAPRQPLDEVVAAARRQLGVGEMWATRGAPARRFRSTTRRKSPR